MNWSDGLIVAIGVVGLAVAIAHYITEKLHRIAFQRQSRALFRKSLYWKRIK